MTKKLIDLSEFENLSREDQFEILQRDGAHIGKRIVANQVVILLQLNSFYVEVFYKNYRKIIDHIIITKDTAILQPYLDQIKIHDLNKGDKE